MSLYLYGVIALHDASDAPQGQVLGSGVGEPSGKVRLLAYRQVAALVSRVNGGSIGEAAGIAALRRDLAAHGRVLDRVLGTTAVLPARFGTVFPNEASLVGQLLEPQYDGLAASLARLHGAVELSVRADYVQDVVVGEVVERQPQLAAQSASAGNYTERIDTGRRIAAAIADRRDLDARWLLSKLSPVAQEIVVGQSESELTVLRASVLVQRKGLPQFDRALEQIQSEAGPRMRLACIGPLPAYSFAELPVEAS